MKTLLHIITIILLITISTLCFSQQKTDYTIESVAGHQAGSSIKSISSTYWYGNTWFFQWYYNSEEDQKGYWLEYTQFDIDSDGSISDDSYPIQFENSGGNNLNFDPYVTSCVFNKSLFVFHYAEDFDGKYICFYSKSMTGDFQYNNVQINKEIDKQMAAVAVNDTLYIFFVDKADRKVKYYRGLYKAHQYNGPDIEWISSTPTVLSQTILSIGNVSACNYTDDNNKEKIMVAFAGDISKGTNEVNIFTGIQNNFDIYKQINTQTDHHAEDVAIEQGSVKGGGKQGYFFQLGYSKTGLGEGKGPIRCEINMDNGEHSNWEIPEIDAEEYILSQLTGFMTYYNKGAFKREKHLYQMFPIANFPAILAIHWKSDRLIYYKTKEQVPPITEATKFYDPIVIVEGAPPYALNGWELSDFGPSSSYPSTFDFRKQTETTITTSTKYSQSIEANMGYGPVTAGFKASFMESSGSSVTKTLTIDEIIHPPLGNADSAGVMFYYYVTPTIKRSQWRLCDYDGDTLLKARNIFFFSFESPQLKTMTHNLSHFTDSPRAYDLETYATRDVENMSGMEKVLRNEMDLNIKEGGTGALDLTFSNSETEEHNASFSVSLGIEAEYEIFSASTNIEVEFEYTRERETKFEKSFHIEWDNPSPKVQTDPNNITHYTAISFVMKTTDESAYYLLEGFKNYKPYFITYQVSNIEYGLFGFESINENLVYIDKYKFKNYPNPCKENTNFIYQLTDKSKVILSVYNTYGQMVNVPISEVQSPGEQKYELFTNQLPLGIYYYQLLIDEDLIMGKIIKN